MKSDGVLLHEIQGTENIFKRVQLLGILLQRHGENFPIMAEITGTKEITIRAQNDTLKVFSWHLILMLNSTKSNVKLIFETFLELKVL